MGALLDTLEEERVAQRERAVAAEVDEQRALVFVEALRRLALKGTEWAQAQVDTIQLKLFKIGALVRVSARRIKVAMASACPESHTWGCAAKRLAAAANARASPA